VVVYTQRMEMFRTWGYKGRTRRYRTAERVNVDQEARSDIKVGRGIGI